MATKPFANAPHHSGAVLSDYLLGIQAGHALDADGLPQMKNIKASELRAFMREGMASVYNYIGEFSVLPETAAVGDVFYASETFQDHGTTYSQGHLYSFNGSAWDDITDLFTQYAKQAEVDAIDGRLATAESQIAAISGGITPKGDILSTNLPTASSANKGWQYYCTDLNKYAVSDGTQWVYFSDNQIVQTLTPGDTSHAPSADTVYKEVEELKNTSAWETDPEAEVVFEGDGENTWAKMERQIPTEPNDAFFLCEADSAPASSSSNGIQGQFFADANYFYICIADNTWRRVALSTF